MCNSCFEGYYGSNCTSSVSCYNGTPQGGIEGNGACSSCNEGWAGLQCSVCASNFGDNTHCNHCINNKYGKNCDQTFGTMKDKSGNSYNTVQIGTQTWMAQNMRYTGVTCEKDRNNDCLYSWDDAKNVCPSEWHLPSEADFQTLASYVKPKTQDVFHAMCYPDAGWKDAYTGRWDEFGFGARPTDMNDLGLYIWSSTQNTNNKWIKVFEVTWLEFDEHSTSNFPLPVRCVKN